MQARIEPRNIGRPKLQNRQGLYARTAKFAFESIDVLVDLMRTSRNENIRLGSARTLLDKCLPDPKAIAIRVEEEKSSIIVKVVADKGLIPFHLKPEQLEDSP